MIGCTSYTFGQAGTRSRTCSGVHWRGKSSGTRLDARAGERELTGVRRRDDGHERRQANIRLVRTCMHVRMHACRGRPGSTGVGVRAVTSAGTRAVMDERG
ncbi:hypothetical protein CRG98_021395 [Punica granatum]|uniref:Uncharacterized protein n=1 Tax=Punica granatum TaxID=22663 RepID=A0A2I0JPJ6_PUNGR|nr:hypothetical protein CRG98_021395 [Punica granatum]